MNEYSINIRYPAGTDHDSADECLPGDELLTFPLYPDEDAGRLGVVVIAGRQGRRRRRRRRAASAAGGRRQAASDEVLHDAPDENHDHAGEEHDQARREKVEPVSRCQATGAGGVILRRHDNAGYLSHREFLLYIANETEAPVPSSTLPSSTNFGDRASGVPGLRHSSAADQSI